MEVWKNAEAAQADPSYYEALTELIYQLADDDYITSFHGSEWLGLAPHIEEDVAFSSITQNTMGHAVLLYNLLEDLGEGTADELAHARPASKRRSSVYLEQANGAGTYLEEPHYDWAFTVIRLYLYETWKKVRLEALAGSSYEPLAIAAQKILMEQPYHYAHWKIWVQQLLHANEDAAERLQRRVEEAWNEAGDVVTFGEKARSMEELGLIPSENALQQAWLREVKQVLAVKDELPAFKLNGRAGEYTEELDRALAVCSEVYNQDKLAVW
jgi:ring-1,2-phenylacetyl-CoA epoxidase subunit PaaC